jgi:hypothetical protein
MLRIPVNSFGNLLSDPSPWGLNDAELLRWYCIIFMNEVKILNILRTSPAKMGGQLRPVKGVGER